MRGIVLTILFLLSGISVGAAELDDRWAPENITQQIRIFDAIVEYPVASWRVKGDYFAQSNFFQDLQPSEYVFNEIPKAEKFESWTKLLGISALKLSQVREGDFEKYIELKHGPFLIGCGEKNFFVQEIQQTEDAYMALFFCQTSPNAPTDKGYGEGIGSIGVFYLKLFQNTFITIHHEWRGKAFRASQKEEWPVSESDIKKMVSKFREIKFIDPACEDCVVAPNIR